MISLAAAMRDSRLFGDVFSAPTFWTWHAIAKLLSGEPLDERELALFKECTGRQTQPDGPINRLTLIVGRRGGKDRFLSAVAIYRAALAADWASILSAGEMGVVILIGTDKKQAKILRRYCEGLLQKPLLADEVVRKTDDIIEFRNGSSLEICTNDAALVRGRSALSLIGTEVAVWPTDPDSLSSDEEVVSAAEPAMAMIPDGGLLVLSSNTYRKQGILFRKWKELHGNEDSDEICWFAPSRVMNPALPEKVVARALANDYARAAAEYLNVWRVDIENFINREIIDAAVVPDRFELAPSSGISYFGFCDPSGGGGQDSMTLAIAHKDRTGQLILDAIRERKPPFSPENACDEFAETLKLYHIGRVCGDRWGGEWPREQLSKRGIVYELSDKTKSEIYRDSLPLLNSGRVELLDNQRLVNQIAGLERRTARGGRDSIDHGPGAHDDIANSALGALLLASSNAGSYTLTAQDVQQLSRVGRPQSSLRQVLPSLIGFDKMTKIY